MTDRSRVLTAGFCPARLLQHLHKASGHFNMGHVLHFDAKGHRNIWNGMANTDTLVVHADFKQQE